MVDIMVDIYKKKKKTDFKINLLILKENRKSSNGINAKFSNVKSTSYWINVSRSKGIKYYVYNLLNDFSGVKNEWLYSFIFSDIHLPINPEFQVSYYINI